MEGPAVVLTREEWEREFLTSQEEYLSSIAMLSLALDTRRKSQLCLSISDMKLLLIYSFTMNYFTMVGRGPGESQELREAIRQRARAKNRISLFSILPMRMS